MYSSAPPPSKKPRFSPKEVPKKPLNGSVSEDEEEGEFLEIDEADENENEEDEDEDEGAEELTRDSLPAGTSQRFPKDKRPKKTQATNIATNMQVYRVNINGQKHFRCPIPDCAKTFTQSGNLKSHLRTHTGERPYSCPAGKCGQTFTALNSVKRHFRRYHAELGEWKQFVKQQQQVHILHLDQHQAGERKPETGAPFSEGKQLETKTLKVSPSSNPTEAPATKNPSPQSAQAILPQLPNLPTLYYPFVPPPSSYPLPYTTPNAEPYHCNFPQASSGLISSNYPELFTPIAGPMLPPPSSFLQIPSTLAPAEPILSEQPRPGLLSILDAMLQKDSLESDRKPSQRNLPLPSSEEYVEDLNPPHCEAAIPKTSMHKISMLLN